MLPNYICYRKPAFFVLTILGSFLLLSVVSQFNLDEKILQSVKRKVVEQLQMMSFNSSVPVEVPVNGMQIIENISCCVLYS